jgi:hypothetical protein
VQNFENPHRVHEFQWGTGEIVAALLDAGLRITPLREFAYANGHAPFKGMRLLGGERFVLRRGRRTCR